MHPADEAARCLGGSLFEPEAEPSEVTPTSCPGLADPIKQIGDPCPHRLAGTQNVQIWTASVMIGIEPTTAPNGGYVRWAGDLVGHGQQ